MNHGIARTRSHETANSRNLEFRNVSFEYEPENRYYKIFPFASGQTVAVLGPTGSGKPLMHLRAPVRHQQGSIILDGVELKEIDKPWLRRHVGLVLQEPFLFSKNGEGKISAWPAATRRMLRFLTRPGWPRCMR